MAHSPTYSTAELDEVEVLPVLIPEFDGKHPFSRGQQIDIYTLDALKKRSKAHTSRNDFFEKWLYGIWLNIDRPVPYAFRTSDGNIRSLDAGCLGFLLHGRQPPDWRPVTDADGNVVAVEPLGALKNRYLPIEEKLRADVNPDGPLGFDPMEPPDQRRREESLRVIREGAREFREQVLDNWDGRCAITGTAIRDVLDAAHICPYGGKHTNDVRNGIPLRVDVHRLFDLHRVSLRYEGNDLVFCVSETLSSSEYMSFDGRRISADRQPPRRPHPNVVSAHYNAFRKEKAATR